MFFLTVLNEHAFRKWTIKISLLWLTLTSSCVWWSGPCTVACIWSKPFLLQVSKKYVSKELAKEIHAKAAPFVKWLKEAEEESEGSEEEEEEEDDENVEVTVFNIFAGTELNYLTTV